MNTRRRVDLIAFVVLAISLSGAVATLYALDHSRRQSSTQPALYLRSATELRRLSLGYTGLLADIYWTRAVQYFGEQHRAGSSDYHLLAPLLELSTQLDPKLLPAYQFGVNFLAPKPPGGAGMPEAALELMKFGIKHNPDQWRLYYNLGFLYYTELKDFSKAAEAFAQGAKLPDTNPFMPILAARMAQHAGEFDTARMLWFTTYQSTKEGLIRENAAAHLVALQVDEDVTRLEEMVGKYQAQTGHLPARMSDLERAGFFRGTPIDPKGHAYRLMADGRIEVQDPQTMYFITKGLPPGMAPPQPVAGNQLNSQAKPKSVE